jgi:DNA primase
MEITDIKTRLTLAEVLQHYNLKPDKHLRLNCPFHQDKTPSLQVYYKTHTAYCFSSSCKTHGKAMDVIDFIMNMEKSTKHEAIVKAEQFITGNMKPVTVIEPLVKAAVLTKMFTYFKNAVHNSKPAQEYISSRSLDFSKIQVGYNSGQFHHGARKEEQLIKSCLQTGLLIDAGLTSKTGDKAYQVFGKWCVVFALRNKQSQVTGLYFRSTVNDKEQKHYYLKNREGLYPEYPSPTTKKLILTEAVIDAATLLQIPEITNQYSILSAYGTNGLTEEHRTAIKELKHLEEIVFVFDNDQAGKQATEKYSKELAGSLPQIKYSTLELPEGEDINSVAQSHNDTEVFTHLLEKRKDIIFSIEISTEKEKSKSTEQKKQPAVEQPVQTKISTPDTVTLNSENPHNLHYKSKTADYYIKGGIQYQLNSMKVSLQIVHPQSRSDFRTKADLYEHKQVETLTGSASEKLSIEITQLEKDISTLTRLLETHRSEALQQQKEKATKNTVHLPEATMNQCLDFLRAPRLMQRINELIGKSGVTGEENSRLFLFTIASSYKMPDTLHALIQGTSGSGKTRLLKTICELMPAEDTIKFTRVTDSSFYNYPENYLVNKLLGFEDIDGLKEDAMYAVRELISNEILVSSTSTKTEDGQISSAIKTVRGPVASISCTTRGEIYEDNMSRVFLIAVDESKAQTKKIIAYQQERAGGKINYKEEKQLKEFLQNSIRVLKPMEVINPFAGKVHLPEEAHKIRRLNDLYLSFVRQVTLLHQYQRSADRQGRLISTVEDLQVANDIMFESILLKVDELDGSLRQFYEILKQYVKKNSEDHSFILREVRQGLNMSKTQLHRYINDLVQLEYIAQAGGYSNKGFKYKILYWDDIEKLRNRIKKQLEDQINSLSEKNKKQAMPAFQGNGTLNGTLQPA